jgi:hypothetical protein
MEHMEIKKPLHHETRRFLANLRLLLLLITPLFLVLTWAFLRILLGSDSWALQSLLSFLSLNGVLIAGFWFPMPFSLSVMHVVTYKFKKRWSALLALPFSLILAYCVLLIFADVVTYQPEGFYPPLPPPHWVELKIIDVLDKASTILYSLGLRQGFGPLWAYGWVWVPQLVALVVFAVFYHLPVPRRSAELLTSPS